MFRRMPACRDHPPLALPHGDDIAVPDADEFARRPQAEIFRLALGFDDFRGVIVGGAVSLHEDGKLLVRSLLALMPHLPAVEPFGQRQPHRAFRFLHQIAGEAVVIEMRMGEGQVLQGTGAQQPSPELVPDLENIVGVHAAIDQRPSRAVVEQPAIDVIGHRRHRQPHPEQSGQDVRQFAIGRRTLDGELQIIGHSLPPASQLTRFRRGHQRRRDFHASYADRDSKIFHSGLERKSFFLEKVRCRFARSGHARCLPRSVGKNNNGCTEPPIPGSSRKPIRRRTSTGVRVAICCCWPAARRSANPATP